MGARRPDIDWDAQPLGRIPDTWIAEDLGCRANAVARARQARGIPPADPRSIPRGIDWSAELDDEVIAERLGVTRQAVCLARRRRRLPPASPPHASSDGDRSHAALARAPDPVPPGVAPRLHRPPPVDDPEHPEAPGRGDR